MAKGNGGGSDVGITVGRISIKVSPDTKKFRADLKEDLEAIERTLKGDIEVTAHLDSAQARADFQRMKSQLQKDGRVKLTVDTVQGKDGVSGKGGGRGGRGGRVDAPSLGLPKFPFPSFGSGINPAGYAAILGGLILVTAPLVGLVSTLVLAIPGMISAIATPMMAIGLGLDGIKKAGANSGLFKYDEDGKLEGLGAVFDKVKAETSAAFEQGLTPALKTLAAAIDPLLGSIPKVATGMTDMFQGFIDSITSEEGTRLFDDTIANIGAAMSQAAPGVKSFTDGFLVLANSFTQQLPGLSTWLNKTGDSFSKWMMEMTKVPDPAGHHGPDPNGKSKMDLAFEGLGGTLETIGAWAVDMAQAGLKFTSDPNKMKDFIATLDNIGAIITKLTDMGNNMAAVWRNTGMLPALNPEVAKVEAEKIINPPKTENGKAVEPPERGWGWVNSALDWLTEDGPGTKLFNNLFPKPIGEVNSEIEGLNKGISELEGNIRERLATSSFAPEDDPALSNYKGRLNDMRAELAELKALQAELAPQVDLKSFETPLTAADGGKPSFVEQMITDLKAVPAAAVPAKDALQQVKDTGAITPEALGAISDKANAVDAAPAKIPPPDTSAFDSALQDLPAATDAAMAAVTASVTTGGVNAAAAALIAAQNIYNAMVANAALFQTVGLQMMAGLAAGINAGSSMAIQAAINAATNALNAAKNALDINSPSKKFIEIGMSTMEGMAVGIDKGFGPVLDQAKDLADKIAEAFADGTTDPTALLKGFNNKDINRIEKVLGIESKRLQAQIDALTYKNRGVKDPAVQAEIDNLKNLKSELGLQKQMVDVAQDYAGIKDSASGGEDPFVKGLSGLMNAPADFAKATGKQFMSDLGIGGDGLIGNAITEGISYIFNIASVDDALSVKDREDSKAARSDIGR